MPDFDELLARLRHAQEWIQGRADGPLLPERTDYELGEVQRLIERAIEIAEEL